MNTVIQPSAKPVVAILEDCEITLYSPDPAIAPLRVLQSRTPEGRILVRFTPTEEQRQAILNGTDIYLSLLTYGKPVPPMMLFTSTELDEAQVVEIMQLDPRV